ncbi:MAG: hypothetical protein EXQ67_08965 [Thermoleophilia bacterium]|nr:hypothetical protein [Thermoleophilia bacterium]
MAYVTPGTVAAGDVATAAAWNVLTNDVINLDARIGLQSIVPTSTAVGGGSVTVSTNGRVTLNAVANSVSLNGVFSATYNHYRIIARITTTTAQTKNFRLRVGGSDASGASDYFRNQNIVEASANYPGTPAAASSWGIDGSTDFSTIYSLDIFDPFGTLQTSMIGSSTMFSTTAMSDFTIASYMHKGLTSFDGFTIFWTGAMTATGTIFVQGYNI